MNTPSHTVARAKDYPFPAAFMRATVECMAVEPVDVLEDWRRHLRAKNKAPRTIVSYL